MLIQLPYTTIAQMAVFLLVFFRMTGIMLSAPLFNNSAFPILLRVWFSFFVALLCFPVAYQTCDPQEIIRSLEHPYDATLIVFGEIALGYLIGWVASFMIWTFQLAGHLVSQEVGLNMGEVFNPLTETSGSALTQFFFSSALFIFVLLGGHRLILASAARSVTLLPLGTNFWNPDLSNFMAQEVAGQMWEQGLQAAMLVMVSLTLVTISMAILARSVPEMNVFILGFSLRLTLGLFATIAVLSSVHDLLSSMYIATNGFIVQLLEIMGASSG